MAPFLGLWRAASGGETKLRTQAMQNYRGIGIQLGVESNQDIAEVRRIGAFLRCVADFNAPRATRVKALELLGQLLLELIDDHAAQEGQS